MHGQVMFSKSADDIGQNNPEHSKLGMVVSSIRQNTYVLRVYLVTAESDKMSQILIKASRADKCFTNSREEYYFFKYRQWLYAIL